MDTLTVRAIEFQPCLGEPAKADWLGFDTSRHCTSRLRAFEEDSTHVLLLLDVHLNLHRQVAWLTNGYRNRLLFALCTSEMR